MIILITAIIIILLTFILINYINEEKTVKTTEGFIVLYDDINDYLKKNVDNSILRDSYCFDNDKLLSQIKGNDNLTCASHYENVSDIHYKMDNNDKIAAEAEYVKLQAITNNSDPDYQKKNNSFYDIRSGKSYSFAELCPITTKQLNGTLCLRKHNNNISDTLFRLDNMLTDTELVMRNNLNDISYDLDTYRNDKYRLFNSSEVQDYVVNNNLSY